MINIKDRLLSGTKFIDLFAGIGGFRLALSSLGSECVFSSEWDSHAQFTYSQNFNETPSGDITQISEYDIPDHDILCAGFPCQAFSISGKQLGFKDTRGTLFFDIARIARIKSPKILFMENVKNFATHDSGRTLKTVTNTLKDIGYTLYYKVLNSADFGIPQKRERFYMVAVRDDLNKNFKFPNPIPLRHYVEDILLPDSYDNIDSMYVSRPDTVLSSHIPDSYQKSILRVGTVNKGGQGERIYSPKGLGITLSAYGGGVFSKTGGYLINGRTRKLHPRECARLMGFPDSYLIHPNRNQAYKQFGNSVVIDVLQYIAINIGNFLKQE